GASDMGGVVAFDTSLSIADTGVESPEDGLPQPPESPGGRHAYLPLMVQQVSNQAISAQGGSIMGKLRGKVAVVTGAAKGIGAEIARDLAAEGAAVVVKYGTRRGAAARGGA